MDIMNRTIAFLLPTAILTFFLGLVLGLALGRGETSSSDHVPPAEPNEATNNPPEKTFGAYLEYDLPKEKLVSFPLENSNRINIGRTHDLSAFKTVSVFSGDRCRAEITFDTLTGAPQYVVIKHRGYYLFEIEFDNEGFIRTETKYEPRSNHGIRKSFSKTGEVLETSTVIVHHG